jgi:SAM-dependent methyltransferase
MTVLEVNTTYEPYSRSPEYIEANRAFVRSLGLEGGDLLDLACGTGQMSACALETAPGLRITGLDLSHEQLGLARAGFAALRPAPEVRLVRGSADRLPLRDARFDACIMGNSIHIIRDIDALLGGIRRVLRPGAIFGFNSSFYAGTFAPGTERFYHAWVKEALLHVQEADRARRARGEAGIPRRREARGGAFSNRWRTGAEWAEVLARNGFRPRETRERVVVMTRSSFEMVGAYAGMAEVLLSGYPVRVASEALQSTVAPALAAVGLEEVPRNWLEMAATAS